MAGFKFTHFCRANLLSSLMVLTAIVLSGCSANSGVKVEDVKNEDKTSLLLPHAKLSTTNLGKIQIEDAPVILRKLVSTLRVSGEVKPEVGKEVHVNTRFSGRVREVLVHPGQKVVAGQVLAYVDSSEVSELQAELIETKSKLQASRAQEERERQIFQEQLERPKWLSQAKTQFHQSKIQLELAEATFQRVEGLFKEKIAAEKDYQSAKACLATAQDGYEQAKIDLQREDRLYKNKAMLSKDYDLAKAESVHEQQHMNTLEQRLEVMGVPPDKVLAVLQTGQFHGSIPIKAPAGGVITSQGVSVGEVIDPDKHAFTIMDLSTVAVTGDLPESDLSKIKLGSQLTIDIPAYPKEHFEGTVDYISDKVNAETRTVAVQARLDNTSGALKENMRAEIEIADSEADVLACPKAAVQERNGQTVVYVNEDGFYHERKVKLGQEMDDYYEVLSGLRQDDVVAVKGSADLKQMIARKR